MSPPMTRLRVQKLLRRRALALFFQIVIAAGLPQSDFGALPVQLSNGAVWQDCSTCADGKMISGLGGPDDGTARFNVSVRDPGLYPVTVRYQVGDNRAVRVTVNTETRLGAMLRRSEQAETLFLPLIGGSNAIVFDNPREPGPDLDGITVSSMPVASTRVSGRVTDATRDPVAGAEVLVSGFDFETRTVTGPDGRYEFSSLPAGDYYLRVISPSGPYFPYEHFCPATNRLWIGQNFIARNENASRKIFVMRHGQWRVDYNLANGYASIFHGGKLLIQNAFAAVRLPETVTSLDYTRHQVSRERIRDGFGRGVKYIVESSNGHSDRMRQTFWFYDGADYFLTQVEMEGKAGLTSGYMSPLTTLTPSSFLGGGDRRVLFVPFDNDKWIRYGGLPFGRDLVSYEVSAFYDNSSREGLVVGSVDHGIWKTGVKSVTTSNALDSLEVFGGVASCETRDLRPHGRISGTDIRSPRIFVGWFADWRDGLESYGRANAIVAPPRLWTGGVPFGWNSWGKLQFRLDYNKAVQTSDFLAHDLPDFQNNGVLYVGLDAGWDKLDPAELKAFVAHCHANHQQAGIYFTPFTLWETNDDAPVPGTRYTLKDVALYANGQKETIAGGVALDPTHPGTQALISNTVAEFADDGFTYVKADFLNYGALEADHYFDPRVTTGIQAYNEGMSFVDRQLGKRIYLDESIAPIFPAQYADSRRIGCDSFGSIGDVEYTLNSLTYGWWLSKVYDFNDPDEIVLDGYSEYENRARVTSAAITGLFISGEDFSAGGSANGKARAREFLGNPEIDALARIKKSFRPVEGDTGRRAANLFSFQDGTCHYLAAFNYSTSNADWTAGLRRAGIVSDGPVEAAELWNGTTSQATNGLSIQLPPEDAEVYRISAGSK